MYCLASFGHLLVKTKQYTKAILYLEKYTSKIRDHLPKLSTIRTLNLKNLLHRNSDNAPDIADAPMTIDELAPVSRPVAPPDVDAPVYERLYRRHKDTPDG